MVESESASIFADCVDLISQIGIVSFKHCMRDQVPHELAKDSFINKISCN